MDATPCPHERLHQVSQAVLRTTWDREPSGDYTPDAEPKVLDESTGTFQCVDCDEHVELTDAARVAE